MKSNSLLAELVARVDTLQAFETASMSNADAEQYYRTVKRACALFTDLHDLLSSGGDFPPSWGELVPIPSQRDVVSFKVKELQELSRASLAGSHNNNDSLRWAELFKSLDRLLSNGAELPDDWSGGRNS